MIPVMNIDQMSRARRLLGDNAGKSFSTAADDVPLQSALVAEDARLRHEIESTPAGVILAGDGGAYQRSIRTRAAISRVLARKS